MKNELIKYLFKESMRTNTNRIKQRNFYSYPILMFVFFSIVIGAVFLINPNVDVSKIYNVGFYIFLITGIMSGAFGMYARDYLERKYGDFGNLLSNSLILPIKMKTIFFSFAFSDMLFYLLWFISPVILAYAMVLLIFGMFSYTIVTLFLSLFFVFLYGFMGAFFLSMLFERSKVIFSLFMGGLFFGIVMFFFNGGIVNTFVYDFYVNPTFLGFFYLICLLFSLIIGCFLTIGREYRTKFSKSKKIKSIKFSNKIDFFIFKDFIDLKRTKGLFGVPFFIVFLPAILLLLMFLNLNNFLSLNIDILFFSIIISLLCVSLFNSLMSSDNVTYYKFLPVNLEDVVKSKIKVSIILSFVYSFLILLGYAFYNNDFYLFLQSMLVFFSMLIYNFNLNFLLTGLNPNERLLDSTVLMKYFVFLFPLVLVFIIVNSIFSSLIWVYFLILVLMLIVSKIYFKLGIKKWRSSFLYD
ncbi:MAG: hypothetical protein PHT94_02885 [Candidatus Nanoarchaeia archaeon]|nr:hypothetical protein [Candidatus Nanoarchaeia archaeon]